MQKKNQFNSKNVARILENLLNEGKFELVGKILKDENFAFLSSNILNTLKRKLSKKSDYLRTRIFSATSIGKQTLDTITKKYNISENDTEIVIDKNLGPGVKIKSGDLKVDATLKSMLEAKVNQLLNQ
jgi:F0F1-type ATP synthase delta subunit